MRNDLLVKRYSGKNFVGALMISLAIGANAGGSEPRPGCEGLYSKEKCVRLVIELLQSQYVGSESKIPKGAILEAIESLKQVLKGQEK